MLTDQKIEQLKSEILALRNCHKSGMERADKLLKELNSLSPSNPAKKVKKEDNEYLELVNKFDSGKWRRNKTKL